jgi:hypothetical protein
MEKDNDKPPFFKTWNAWYFAVIAFLAVLIILFFLFTRHFQ